MCLKPLFGISLLLLSCLHCSAASVLLGITELETSPFMSGSTRQYTLYNPFMELSGTIGDSGLLLHPNAYSYMEFAVKAVVAKKADVVNASYIDNQSSYLYYSELNTETHDVAFSDYDIQFAKGERKYVAYEWTGMEGSKSYGWFELGYSADGVLGVTQSALALSGGVIIVGATPEPSCGLLLILGSMMLLLKRRRTFAQ